MRLRLLALALAVSGPLVAVPAAQSDAPSRPSEVLDTPFAANGAISMRLSAGGYRISAGRDDRIRLRWSVRRQSQLSEVEAYADVDGAEATVIMDGPGNEFHAVIEVPARTDLHLRLSAGELSIEEVVGDKDIRLHAGEVRVDVGNPATYRRVRASVWAGELRAAPFGRRTGGLFRSLDWRGDGEHDLRVRLKAGELRLYSKSAADRAQPR